MYYIAKAALAALVLVTACDQADGTTIGPRGGVVISEDGRFSLEVPAGALDQEVDITIEEIDCEQDTAIGPCYETGPIGFPLLFPGTITYELDEEMMEGLTAEELEVLTAREEAWKPLADHRVDMSDEIVTASAVYLSSYAVVVTE